jgi:hypothetical protein
MSLDYRYVFLPSLGFSPERRPHTRSEDPLKPPFDIDISECQQLLQNDQMLKDIIFVPQPHHDNVIRLILQQRIYETTVSSSSRILKPEYSHHVDDLSSSKGYIFVAHCPGVFENE